LRRRNRTPGEHCSKSKHALRDALVSFRVKSCTT
jgi:hypothetical protein